MLLIDDRYERQHSFREDIYSQKESKLGTSFLKRDHFKSVAKTLLD